MLKALKPNESIYDITKLYKRISRIKIKKQQRNLLNKIALPRLSGAQLLQQNLEKSISISNRNNLRIHKIHLNYKNNLQNIAKNINDNTNIYEKNFVLSENDKNLVLPKVSKNKNYFSEKNSPEKCEKNCNFLYLKYEGENYTQINNKVYIKIFPHKIIHSMKKILNTDKNIINKLEQKINSMVDKYTTTSNLNSNYFTSDFNTLEIDLNEFTNTEENKYILLTQNENKQNQPFFRIKNIFLENIIQNVTKRSIEIMNEKNQVILKGDIENEFMNQIELLRKFFTNEIRMKITKRTKEIKIRRNLLKTYNKLFLSNFEENENYIDSIINKKDELYLTERNKGNFEVLNLFKNKLNISQSIHNLYYNVITNNTNNLSPIRKRNEDIKINSENELKKNETENNINQKSKLNIYNFYKKYIKLKDDLNISKNSQKEKSIFDLRPNIKIVSFDEVSNELDNLKKEKSQNDTRRINNTNLFLLMMSDDSLSKNVNFRNIKDKNIFKMFKNKNKNYIIKTQAKQRKSNDILKILGKKLHRYMNIKLGRNRNKKNLNQTLANRTIYSMQRTQEESISDNNNRAITENKFILNETNSSLFSDIPSDLSMSYSEMKREKEENAKKIKKIMDNKDKYNFDADANIFDLDQFLLNIKKQTPKSIKKIVINKNEIESQNKKEIKDKNKDIETKKEKSRNIVDYNKNITNELIKEKIKKKNIKLLHINRDLENYQPKSTKDENTQKKLSNNQQIPKLINKNESESKNVSKNIQKISNNAEKTNIKIINKEKKEIKETKEVKEISANEESNSVNKNEKRRKKIHKKRNKKRISINNEPNEIEEKSEDIYEENDLENDEKEIPYNELMILFNNKFNIPGKRKNHIKLKRKYSNENNSTYASYFSTINTIEREKLTRNKSFSFIKTRNDKRLILLRPPLVHILKKKNSNIKKLKEAINRLFTASKANLLDINIDNKRMKSGTSKYKERMSYDYYGNYENYKNHRILMDKFFGSRKKIEKNYLQDDFDLLLDTSNEQKKKFVKKKAVRRRGFRDFMNDEDMLQPNQLSIDYFENRRKENDKIRSIIEAERLKKKKKMKEIENKMNKFKSYITDLKNMSEEQLRYDTIRFIFKIKADPENIKLSKKVSRINGFKKYIKNNEIIKLNNNESILQNVLFQPNCIFYTDKISKV